MSSENLKIKSLEMFLTKASMFLNSHKNNIQEIDPQLAEKTEQLKAQIDQFINENFSG